MLPCSRCCVLDELHELGEQLSDKDHQLRDSTALIRRLEVEKSEMQTAIEEADTALEQQEAKLQRALQEQSEQRAELDRRVADKEADFETTRSLPPLTSPIPSPH